MTNLSHRSSGCRSTSSLMDKISNRIFLLSPARCDGLRAQMLTSDRGQSQLARELKNGGATIASIFTFLSNLYFRGKVTYAMSFANPPEGVPGILVITPGFGLCAHDEVIDAARLRAFGEVEVDENNSSYRGPLEQDAFRIAAMLRPGSEVVLLGSIATGKYTQILEAAFGRSLKFPASFVGRGDMSRGGLMLRAAESGIELEYIEVAGAVRRGPRPPKLPSKK